MLIHKYVGKSIEELAKTTGVFWRPIRVFVLENQNDCVGRFLTTAYKIQQVIIQFPAVKTATVISAENYLGETILRIRAS